MPELVNKVSFLDGLTCATKGWTTLRAPREDPGDAAKWRFYEGEVVSRAAQQHLGEGPKLPIGPRDVAEQSTKAALADPNNGLLYEATFVAAGCITRADALRRTGKGWIVIEVKSGVTPKAGDEPKDEYFDDLAYTVYVARAAGLQVVGAVLVLVNREYRLTGVDPVVVEVNAWPAVGARLKAFEESGAKLTGRVGGDERPVPEMIFSCGKCDYFADSCVGMGIDDSLFVLPRLSEKRFEELKGFKRIRNLRTLDSLTDNQRLVAEVSRSATSKSDKKALAELDKVVWPAHYLDFEAIQPALPWFEDRPPYDAVPFQFSIHRLDRIEAAPTHIEYLAEVGADWRRDLVDRLIAELGGQGSIVVYSSYEKTRLKSLAALFPSLQKELEGLIARLFDLEGVIKNGYIHPGFGGRTSIKKVLPVMVPSLSYDGMSVADGETAAGTFGLMRVGRHPTESHPVLRKNLLDYCKLDTLAMVELHKALHKARGA